GADEELVALCLRCLRPVRDERPAAAGEVAAAVGRYLEGREARARQLELAAARAEARAAQAVRVRRLTLALASAAVLVVVGGGLGWAYLDREARGRMEARAREVAVSAGRVQELLGAAKQTPI